MVRQTWAERGPTLAQFLVVIDKYGDEAEGQSCDVDQFRPPRQIARQIDHTLEKKMKRSALSG
jgi:hypothetical protein